MSHRSRRPVFGDPRLRTATLVTLAVIVVAGLVLHLQPSLTLVLLLSVAAVVGVARLIGSAELVWPPRQDEPSSHGWGSVAMLAHSLAVADSSPSEFDRMISPRLARLATAALIREGADWDTASARAILGARVHEALRPDAPRPDTTADPGSVSAASRTALAAATLDVLERLDLQARTADEVRPAS